MQVKQPQGPTWTISPLPELLPTLCARWIPSHTQVWLGLPPALRMWPALPLVIMPLTAPSTTVLVFFYCSFEAGSTMQFHWV